MAIPGFESMQRTQQIIPSGIPSIELPAVAAVEEDGGFAQRGLTYLRAVGCHSPDFLDTHGTMWDPPPTGHIQLQHIPSSTLPKRSWGAFRVASEGDDWCEAAPGVSYTARGART